ncbi:MAG TPA: hypothetical protein VN639_13170 [Azonexus sp.]|nr:hypothetical protein [Azonexus sp.]
MALSQKLIRLTLAAALLGSLSACVVAPSQPVGYRAPPSVYIETYPTYRYGHPDPYYNGYGPRYYGDRDGRYYRDERRYEEQRPREVIIPGPAEVHRDIRRSLGLPRLPGMP